MKVLIAEDDRHILEGLKEILEREGYDTVTARDGRQAVVRFEEEAPDVVLLDIMMPQVDGYEVCRTIRKKHPSTPVLFITAKSEEIDKVVGLELGADDYITKPFGVREVIARIRAVTRRCLAQPETRTDLGIPPFRMGDLDVTPAELRARRGEETIELSLRDVRILSLLHRHKGQVVDRPSLFRHAWGVDHVPNSRTLDQHISQLRKRIEKDPQNPLLIQTVHGVGYRHDGE